MSRDLPKAQGPNHEKTPQVGSPKNTAGGIPAVTHALKKSVSEMGVTRSIQTLLKVNQKDGFDCPGCAWPDPDDRRSMVEFCENGAKAVAEEATLHRADPEFFAGKSLVQLADETDYWLGQQGRLTHPMELYDGYYRPISWDAAFHKIASALNALTSPHEAVFYTSGRTSNEAAFLYQLFVRQFGTNNLPDCSNLCHESSGYALSETLGTGKGTVSLEDFDHADCILVVGQNPGTNHPRMLTSLQAAARRGCKIISVNPLPEAGLQRFRHPQDLRSMVGRATTIATLHLPVKINGDVALFKGILKALVESHPEAIDRAFIQKYTEGFDAFIADLRDESWSNIVESSGLTEHLVRDSAKLLAASKRLICCWAMGLTQHQNAVGNIQEVVNLLLLGGHFGRAGAGACPVRGHSNVQGDRTMGIWERPQEDFLRALDTEFGFTSPRAHGFDVVHAIRAMAEGRVRVFLGLGGNFLSASPDTEYTARALRTCALTVHISTKLNRSHLITGKEALILPCLGRTEIDLQQGRPQFVTVENSMGVVHASRGNLAPASEWLKSEIAIVAGVAASTLKSRSTVRWQSLSEDYDCIRDHIARVIPGFQSYNERVREPGGFVLPHSVRDRLEFNTPSKKARFTVHPIPKHELKAGQFLMATVRTHDQYNTTIYGLQDRYRGILEGRRVVLIHEEDIRALGRKAGDCIDLVSHYGGETRRAHRFVLVAYCIPPGCVVTYFPETNVLVPIQSTAFGSHTPTSKSVVVSIEDCESLQ